LKYVPFGRARGIPKLETFNSFTGLPPCWSEVLFVCVPRPFLARILTSRASGVTWVVSRVSKLALIAPVSKNSLALKIYRLRRLEKNIKCL
jgi:hypothetical protein